MGDCAWPSDPAGYYDNYSYSLLDSSSVLTIDGEYFRNDELLVYGGYDEDKNIFLETFKKHHGTVVDDSWPHDIMVKFPVMNAVDLDILAATIKKELDGSRVDKIGVTFREREERSFFSSEVDSSKIVSDPDGGIYPLNIIVVNFKNGVNKCEVQDAIKHINGKIVGRTPSINLVIIEVDAKSIKDLRAMIKKLDNDSRVQGAMTNNIDQLDFGSVY